ncbi:hypothetical protein [Paenibacillus odorifer]|uniref:Uncharacterized protein n=1 Tax=Paenibacillus odorifer TaxID=189426 RepID=A0A1R0XMI7_9BACL|nr:hypothetical protein [Paenibacillus odorifer]OMD36343.1 hypothetical protein BSK52_24965 [Paenibacillus odorifer]
MVKFTRTQKTKEKRAGIAIFFSAITISLIAITLQLLDFSIFYEYLTLICSSILIAIVIRRRIKHRVRVIEGIKFLVYIGIAMLTLVSLLINFNLWTEETLLINLFIIIVSVLESISN